MKDSAESGRIGDLFVNLLKLDFTRRAWKNGETQNLVFNANLTYVKIQLNSFGPQIGVYDENKLPSSFLTNTHSDFTQIHKSIEFRCNFLIVIYRSLLLFSDQSGEILNKKKITKENYLGT